MAWLASLYWALWETSNRTLGPRQADELELWEIATLLQGSKAWGIEPQIDEAAPADDHAHLRARLRGEKFEWPEPTAAEQQANLAIMNALG